MKNDSEEKNQVERRDNIGSINTYQSHQGTLY